MTGDPERVLLGDPNWPNLSPTRRAALLKLAQEDGQPWTEDQANSGWTDHMAEVMYGEDLDVVVQLRERIRASPAATSARASQTHLRAAVVRLREDAEWNLRVPDPHEPDEDCRDCNLDRLSLAVADWLEWMASRAASGNGVPGMRGMGLREALAVADAVVGRAAHD